MRPIAFAFAVFLSLCCAQSKTTEQMDRLREDIEAKIAAVPGASVAVVYKNLATQRTFALNDRQMMHAASTMKVPVMIEVFKQAEHAQLRLADSILVRNEFRSIVDGSRYAMDIGEDSDDSIYGQMGKKMTLQDLTYQMITVSSNLATNLLIDLVGAEKVMKTMKEIGAQDIQVLRGVEDLKAYRAGRNNTTNAYDLMLIMEAIAEKRVVSARACEQMMDIMSAQVFNDKIPALLPANVKIAHKTGSITEIDHDFGIVSPPNLPQYILVILTKGISDHEQAKRLIAEVSLRIHTFHTNSYTS